MVKPAAITSLGEESRRSMAAVLLVRGPMCTHIMGLLDPCELSDKTCALCGFVLREERGIWRALAPDRQRRFSQFMREYQEVRAREGRGSSSPDYYLALPYADLTGRNSWQWSIRSLTFRCLLRRLLPRLEQSLARPLDILDIGAGNGWLSYRLAERGHALPD